MATAPSTAPGSHKGFRQAMGRYDYIMASMGGVIGSGWLFSAMYSAQMAGPAAIFSWIIGGILMTTLAVCWGEMGSFIPEAGAVSRFPMMTHGSLAGGLASWAIAVGAVLAAPVESMAVIQYAAGYIPSLYDKASGMLTVEGMIAGMILIIVFFIINWFGVRALKSTNTWVTTIKWLVPTIAMILLLVAGFAGGGSSNFSSAPGGFMPFGFHGVLAAVSVGGIVYAFSGFRQSLDLAAEGHNPQRDVPRAILTVLLFALCLYTLLQVAFIVAVPKGMIAGGWAHVNFASPWAQLAAGFNMGILATLLYADGAWSPAGSGLLFTGTSSRLLYAIPKNGFHIKGFLEMSDNGIPLIGQIVTLIIGLLSVLPIPSWHYLIELTSSLGLITYALGGPCMAVFHKIAPDVPRKFSLGWFTKIAAPATFAIGTMLFYFFGWPTTMQTDLIMLVGLILYVIYNSVYHYPKRDIKAGLWMPVMFAFVLVMSYLGSFGTGNLHLIQFPLDVIIVVIGAIIIHYWAVASGYETQHWLDYKAGKNRDWKGELDLDNTAD